MEAPRNAGDDAGTPEPDHHHGPDAADDLEVGPEAAPADVPGAQQRISPGRFTERGRDLLLLALALVIINEAIFTFYVIAEDSAALTAQMGRFALKAGMAYMTWQGYAISRWILAFLVGAAIVAGPFALSDAFRSGNMIFTAILTATFVAYVASGWLLVFARDVADFITHRRYLREQEWLQ